MRKIATGLFVTALFCALSVTAQQLPNIDALATRVNLAMLPRSPRNSTLRKGGTPIQVEPRLGVPVSVGGPLTDSPSILPAGRGGNTTGPARKKRLLVDTLRITQRRTT